MQKKHNKILQDISDAFQTLSDPEKRRIYDQFGEDGLQGSGADPSRFHSGFMNANDLFREIFQQHFGFSGGPSGFHSFF